MPAARAYTATASATYKGKTKDVPVQVLSTTPGTDAKTRTVRVGLLVLKHRTVMITVTAQPAK